MEKKIILVLSLFFSISILLNLFKSSIYIIPLNKKTIKKSPLKYLRHGYSIDLDCVNQRVKGNISTFKRNHSLLKRPFKRGTFMMNQDVHYDGDF